MRRFPVNASLVVSLASVVLAAVVVLWCLPPVFGALLTPRPGDDPMRTRLDQYLTAHQEDLVAYEARFDGRSLFFKPQPPPPPAPTHRPPRIEQPTEPSTPAPPPVARTYGGPSVMFVVGDEVWFHDGETVRVGEKGDNGVTVISADPPWSVRLGHGGGEYDVELFKREFPGFAEEPEKPRPVPGLVQVKPEADRPPGSADDGAPSRTP